MALGLNKWFLQQTGKKEKAKSIILKWRISVHQKPIKNWNQIINHKLQEGICNRINIQNIWKTPVVNKEAV